MFSIISTKQGVGYLAMRVAAHNMELASVGCSVASLEWLFRYLGVSIAKPHLKTAAKHIIGDVMTNIAHAASTPKQQGSGMRVYARRATKYPPIGCGRTRAPARRRKQNKRLASIKKRAKPKRIRKVATRRFRGAANDIFI